MKSNKPRSSKQEPAIRIWSYEQTRLASPYICSIMRSLRDTVLEAQQKQILAERLASKPGRMDRKRILEQELAWREAREASDRFHEALEELRPIANIQNRMHAADPATYRRDARTAFLMEPKEHLAVLREVDDRKLKLKAVYHSHPDHDAYFSATDRTQACSFDPNEPDYPAIAYIVLSIRGGEFACAAAFVWDATRREFVETALEVV